LIFIKIKKRVGGSARTPPLFGFFVIPGLIFQIHRYNIIFVLDFGAAPKNHERNE
jgi:hypothetical protein